MSIAYDLVILGGSSVGRLAALQAAQLRSRVALIEPVRSTSPDFLPLFYQQWRQGAAVAVARSRAASAEKRSLAFLATQGVDVCIGQAEFESQAAVIVDGRQFRSRTYLLAPDSEPIDRALSLESIAAGRLPSGKIALIGSSPIALEVSQVLSRSIDVTLHLPRPLAGTDGELFLLLRSSLEASGVQIEVDPSSKAISLDRQPQLASLNLAAAGVEVRSNVIPVNARLQATNPRIYACGEALGGYRLPHLAEVEAAIALENALFWPRKSVDYGQIPWAVRTLPELAQVGLSERQARRQFGRSVEIVRRSYRSIDAAKISGEPIGLAKFILRSDGRILGAHLLGTNAAETIAPVALALQQKRSMQDLAAVAPSASWGEILAESAQQWQRDRLANWQREWLERWFDWRR